MEVIDEQLRMTMRKVKKRRNPSLKKKLHPRRKRHKRAKRRRKPTAEMNLGPTTAPQVLTRKRLNFRVMEEAVTMNLTNLSRLAEVNPRRKPPKETVMMKAAEKNGEEGRREERKAKSVEEAVMMKTAITRNLSPRRQNLQEEPRAKEAT